MALLPYIEDPLASHLDQLSSYVSETDPHRKFTLLHEIVIHFEKDRRYLNDMRYVQLWLEYASFFADPRWVYAHMMAKNIGIYIGAVYEQVAEYYIGRQRWKDADRVLSQGIDSRAEPAAKLQHKLHQVRHHIFQEKQAVQAAAELAKEVPQRILNVFDWIDSRLSYEGRRAMVKECFVYTHEETSFEEIRARRWRKRTYNVSPKRVPPPPSTIPNHRQEQQQHKKKQNLIAIRPANALVNNGKKRRKPPLSPPTAMATTTNIRPALKHADNADDNDHPSDCVAVVGIPHEPALEERILGKLRPPLASYAGFYNVSHIDHRPRVANRKIVLCSESFTVIRKLGQGGMASVYELVTDGNESYHYAAKIESPPNPWEFYICRQVTDRAPHISLTVHAFYMYGNTGILLMDVACKGTLLDALNTYRSTHRVAAMPEPLVISLARQLIAAIGALHNVGIIHGDLKIDNVVMLDQEGGGQRIGLIDFGRAVDLRMLPNNIRLNPRWPIGPIDPSVLPPWDPWLVDKWGLAGILHMLLFGKTMETVEHRPPLPGTAQQHQQHQKKRWGIRDRLKRYWQQQAWETVFDELLNNSQQGVDAAAAALSMLPQRCRDNDDAGQRGMTKI